MALVGAGKSWMDTYFSSHTDYFTHGVKARSVSYAGRSWKEQQRQHVESAELNCTAMFAETYNLKSPITVKV